MRRAPRLSHTERIAPYITRSGRFRRIDPLQARALPSWPKVVGFVGWGVLLVESLRRARRRYAGEHAAAE